MNRKIQKACRNGEGGQLKKKDESEKMNEQRCVNCMMQIAEGTEVCPHCGQHQTMENTAFWGLRWNTVLGDRYLVGKVLGQGGFGITYVGYDRMLDIKVAIKEFFPAGYASRNGDGSNQILWNTVYLSRQQWQKGCDGFLKEARRMAKIDHIPEIVRVRDTFQENQTAYIVMDFVEGMNLKQKLMQQGVMKFSQCMELLTPLLKSLVQVHEYGLIHRDISPDNIMIQPDGNVRLLDFGAAKDISLRPEVSQLVTKKGFSPPEQYGGKGNLGPWTDVYAICATIYYCITGRMIPEAMDRMCGEELSFDVSVEEPLTEEVKTVLRRGLELSPEQRIRSVQELLEALETAMADKKESHFPIRKNPVRKRRLWAVMAVAAALLIGVSGNRFYNVMSDMGLGSAQSAAGAGGELNGYGAESSGSGSGETGEGNFQDQMDESGMLDGETESAETAEAAIETQDAGVDVNITAADTAATDTAAADAAATDTAATDTAATDAAATDTAAADAATADTTWQQAVQNTVSAQAANHQGSRILMADGAKGDYNNSPGNVLGSKYQRSSIKTVTFLNTLADMPADAWDASAEKDGSVMAWVQGTGSGYELYVAGEGGVKAPESCRNLFRGYSNVTAYHFNGCFDTSSVKEMRYMFMGNKSLTEVNLESFDTGRVTAMPDMFASCTALQKVDLASWNVSSVKNFFHMFGNCSQLSELDMSQWDVHEDAEVREIFQECYSMNYEKAGLQLKGYGPGLVSE